MNNVERKRQTMICTWGNAKKRYDTKFKQWSLHVWMSDEL